MAIAYIERFYEIFSYFSRKELILLQTLNHRVNCFIQHFFQNHPPYICFKYVYLDALGDCYVNGRNHVIDGQKVCIYGNIIGRSCGAHLNPRYKGIPPVGPVNLVVPGTDFCWRKKFHKLHPLLLSTFLRVKQVEIVFLEPASIKSSHEFIDKILQLSHLWKGQRLHVTMYYSDIAAQQPGLLKAFGFAKVLVIELNLDVFPSVYILKKFSKRKEWYNHKIADRTFDGNIPLIPSSSLLDFAHLQQCQRLILPVYGTIEVNYEDLVEYLNSKPLANNQPRELYFLTHACTKLDTKKLVKLLVKNFMSASNCCPYAFLFSVDKQEMQLSSILNIKTKEKLEMHVVNISKPCSWRILTRAGISDHAKTEPQTLRQMTDLVRKMVNADNYDYD